MMADLAKDHNAVVLVPSHARAALWKDDASATVSTMKEITTQVQALRDGHVGVVVVVNRYDGIDLPGDACRLLVIDGVPQAYNGIERREALALRNSRAMTSRQMQRVEQGMGRGVRSRDDRCAIVVLGAGLTSLMAQPDVLAHLSPATRAQLSLSRTVAGDMRGAGITEITTLLKQVIDGDPAFREASRGALAGVVYAPANINPSAADLRAAYNASVRGDEHAAAAHAMNAVEHARQSGDAKYAGWLSETWADATHPIDRTRSQQILIAGRAENPAILRPITGAGYQRLTPQATQAEAAKVFLSAKFGTGVEVLMGGQAALDEITWNTERTHDAEVGIADLGSFLGLPAQRPEEELGVGPDVLWSLGNHAYAVIEAKTGSEADLIHKKDVNQLAGSVNWCEKQYGSDATVIPVLVHRKSVVERTGTAPAATRIITAAGLKALKAAVVANLAALGDDFRDADRIAAALRDNHLTGAEILGTNSPYTIAFTGQR